MKLFTWNLISEHQYSKGINGNCIIGPKLTLKLRLDFIKFRDRFLNDYSVGTPIDELWKEFKQACNECLQQVANALLSAMYKVNNIS